ncbi:MAG: GspMb/PilO family protein [Elusimicrobia bacterium]|nr:GspMb/PilO family protein [Elusimicrobiota bacterium]
MAKIDLNQIAGKVQDEIRLLSSTLKEKGSERFSRTLSIALVVPIVCYFMVYARARKRLNAVAGELAMARATATYLDTYKDLKSRLDYSYAMLPLPKDRANFLSDAVKEALRAEGIVATDFQPPSDVEVPGGVVQNLNIRMRVKFPELMAFLTRMESSKPVIYINNLDISKLSEPIGLNDVSCGLSTIIPLERF